MTNNEDLRYAFIEAAKFFRGLVQKIKEVLERKLKAAILWVDTPVHPAVTWKPMKHQTIKPQVIINKPSRIRARSSC